jgi:hypothetical protein
MIFYSQENNNTNVILSDITKQYEDNRNNIIISFIIGLILGISLVFGIYKIMDFINNKKKLHEQIYEQIQDKKDLPKYLSIILDEYKTIDTTKDKELYYIFSTIANKKELLQDSIKTINIKRIIYILLENMSIENLQKLQNKWNIKITDKGT